jgi:chromosome partitioning protein
VRSSANPKLKMQGILLTMYDKRNNLSEMVANNVKTHLGKYVYKTIIPRNVRVSEAPSHGKPVLLYDKNCSGSLAYTELAKEFMQNKQEEHAVL